MGGNLCFNNQLPCESMIEVGQDLRRSSGQTSSSKREFRPGCSGLVFFSFGVVFFVLFSGF